MTTSSNDSDKLAPSSFQDAHRSLKEVCQNDLVTMVEQVMIWTQPIRSMAVTSRIASDDSVTTWTDVRNRGSRRSERQG